MAGEPSTVLPGGNYTVALAIYTNGWSGFLCTIKPSRRWSCWLHSGWLHMNHSQSHPQQSHQCLPVFPVNGASTATRYLQITTRSNTNTNTNTNLEMETKQALVKQFQFYIKYSNNHKFALERAGVGLEVTSFHTDSGEGGRQVLETQMVRVILWLVGSGVNFTNMPHFICSFFISYQLYGSSHFLYLYLYGSTDLLCIVVNNWVNNL